MKSARKALRLAWNGLRSSVRASEKMDASVSLNERTVVTDELRATAEALASIALTLGHSDSGRVSLCAQWIMVRSRVNPRESPADSLLKEQSEATTVCAM